MEFIKPAGWLQAQLTQRHCATPEQKLPRLAAHIEAAAPLLRGLLLQGRRQQALNGEHRWLKAMEIKASHRKGVDPAIELIVGQAGQQPVIASLLPAHGSLLQRKGQGQGGLLPHQPRHDLRIRLPATGQLQRAQHHRFWRQQRASTWGLDTALEQQITNQIAQGLGEYRHASIDNATGKRRLLPALQLQLTANGLIRQQRDRIRLDADGNTARAQRPQQLLTQGG